MGLHIAEIIMQSVKETLTGLSTTGNYVERARVYPFDKSIKNSITITMGSDEFISSDEITSNIVDSLLTVLIDIHVKNNDVQIDTQLNLIRSEIVLALMLDHTQGGIVIDTNEEGSEEPEVNGTAESITAQQRMTFTFRYRRLLTDPTTS